MAAAHIYFPHKSHGFTARTRCSITPCVQLPLVRKIESQRFLEDVRVSVTFWAAPGRYASILLKFHKQRKGGFGRLHYVPQSCSKVISKESEGVWKTPLCTQGFFLNKFARGAPFIA